MSQHLRSQAVTGLSWLVSKSVLIPAHQVLSISYGPKFLAGDHFLLRPLSACWITGFFFLLFLLKFRPEGHRLSLSPPLPSSHLTYLSYQRLTWRMLATSSSLVAVPPSHKPVPVWSASDALLNLQNPGLCLLKSLA